MADGEPERFGPYVVRDALGQGGMSTVHLAERTRDDGTIETVALKRLLPAAASRRELRASFAQEAKLTRHLNHPNIAATLDSGNVGEIYFIAMEYVPGPTLKQLLDHCAATVGTVPIPITLNIASQICEALQHAHECIDETGKALRIVHRDVSPSNIILSDHGIAKLIDFGLAKAKTSTVQTAEGVIKGKFNYVAPEYLGGKLDARADLWALGVVLYELLTGRRLFDAPDTFETMTRVRKLPIPRPSLANPRVPPELDEVVMTALERTLSKRWQSASEMRVGLRRVVALPEHEVDNRHVAEWMSWVFTQRPGTEASGVSKLLAMTKPKQKPPPIPPPRRKGWLDRLRSSRTRR